MNRSLRLVTYATIALTIVLLQCQSDNVTTPGVTQSPMLRVSVMETSLAQDIEAVVAVIRRLDSSLVFTDTTTLDQRGRFEFETVDLPAEELHIVVSAIDGSGRTLYSGDAVVTIVENQDNEIPIMLLPAVPMIRLAPYYLEVMQTADFISSIELYNIARFSQGRFAIVADPPILSLEDIGVESGTGWGSLNTSAQFHMDTLFIEIERVSATDNVPQGLHELVRLSSETHRSGETELNLIVLALNDHGGPVPENDSLLIDLQTVEIVPPNDPIADCEIDPDALEWGDTPVGDTAVEREFTITSTGTLPLEGNISIPESCDQFSIVSGGGDLLLEPGESRVVTVRFNPTNGGQHLCRVETSSDCHSVQLFGGAVEPVCSLSSTSLSFGDLDVSSGSVDKSFSISNTGTTVLSGSVSESCDHYSIISGAGDFTLNPGDPDLTVTVRFDPSVAGAHNCTIETGLDACADVSCSGTGTETGCSVDPSSLAFGDVDVSSGSVDKSFSISNTGTTVLSGSVSESCDHYSIISGAGDFTLNPGDPDLTVTVRFDPSVAGAHNCTIETGLDACADVSCSGTGTETGCSVDPSSLAFGDVDVSSGSVDKSFSISNTGTTVLSGSVSESCDHYSIISGAGDFTLNPGDPDLTVTVRFDPSVAGAHNCTIETGLDACADVSCSGTGTETGCSVDPSSLAFGDVDVSSGSVDKSFSISNTGTTVLSGSVSESCDHYSIISGAGDFTLNPGDPDLTVTVRFDPSVAGAHNCTIETGLDACADVSCSGTGTETGCSVDPSSLAFGDVDVSSGSVDKSFSISNTGTTVLSGSVSESCDHYSIISGAGDFTLNPGDPDLTVTVRFDPSVAGAHNCTIETGLDACADVSCSGTGTETGCSVDPSSLAFGDVDVSSGSVDKSFSISNTGTTVLSGSVSESCDHYSIISGAGDFTLNPGDPDLTVTVRFDPSVAGAHNCTIETGLAACADVSCSGTGTETGCSVDPSSLAFGDVDVSSGSVDKSFSISNTGTTVLSGSVSESCDHYSIISGAGDFTLNPGDPDLTVTVRFDPSVAGAHNCTIETGLDACADVSCSGTGTETGCSVDPSSLAFGDVDVSSGSVDKSFSISNTGTTVLSGSVSESCDHYSIISGAGDFTLNPGDPDLTVTVRFDPSVAGAHNCTIETGLDACADVSCSGTGTETGCSVDPSSLAFGDVDVSSGSVDKSFSISNTGTTVLSGSVSESCDHYSIISGAGDFTLNPGDPDLTVTVRFDPSVAGAHNCTIETGLDACADVSCSGTGTETGCSVDPSSLAFGDVDVSSGSVDKSFSISNTGTTVLSGSVSESCDHYSIISGAGDFTLNPGDPDLTVTVRFDPSVAGAHNCTIETGLDACADVSCSGTGTETGCSVDPSSLAFGDVDVSSGSVDKSFSISNTGTTVLSGSVSESCDHYSIISGAGDFTLNPGDPDLTVTVRFDPSVAGAHNCTIETGLAACGTVSCSGTGTGSISVTSPAPLGVWKVPTTLRVEWTTTGISGNVRIDLIRPGESILLIADTPNDEQEWVPIDASLSERCDWQVVVTDVDEQVADTSGQFCIKIWEATTADTLQFRANFDNDTLGNTPLLSLINEPIGDYVTPIEYSANGNTARVRSSVGDLLTKPLELVKQVSSPGSPYLRCYPVPRQGCDTVVLSWRSLVTSSMFSFGSGPDVLIKDVNGGNSTLATMRYESDGGLTFNESAVPVSYQTNVAQDFALVVDFASKTTSLSIDDVAIVGFQNVPFIDFAADEIDRFYFRTGSSSAEQGFAVDDIEMRCYEASETPACTPQLIGPAEGATLDNGCQGTSDFVTWYFNWASCADADSYHIQVEPPPLMLSPVDNVITDTTFTFTDLGFFDQNIGWSWKVRAFSNSQWGDWSESRTFTLEPYDTDCPSAPKSVVVSSLTVPAGATDIAIPIKISNDVSIRALIVPLRIRELDPGAFVTDVQFQYQDRLPLGGPLNEVIINSGYSDLNGPCFASNAASVDLLPHPVLTDSPEHGVLFARHRIFGSSLGPGTDATGSLELRVTVSATEGQIEIDSSCIDPTNHLVFLDDGIGNHVPEFTKGVITIGPPDAPLCTPTLSAPSNFATLDNGCSAAPDADTINWDFDWSDCPGDTMYNLLVFTPDSSFLIYDTVTVSEYHYEGPGEVLGEFLDFEWRVRSGNAGVWGPWSETRTFTLEADDTDCPLAAVNLVVSATPMGGIPTLHPNNPPQAVVSIPPITIRNNGDGSASAFSLRYFLAYDDSTGSCVSPPCGYTVDTIISGLAAGDSLVLPFPDYPMPCIAAGSYFIGVYADPDGLVTETTTDDNFVSFPVALSGGSPLVDLEVFASGQFSVSPPTADYGVQTTLSFPEFWIRNDGIHASCEAELAWFILDAYTPKPDSGQCFDPLNECIPFDCCLPLGNASWFTIPGLAPGDSISCSSIFCGDNLYTSTLTPAGFYRVGVFVNIARDRSVIPESDFTNNSLGADFDIE